MSYSLPCFSYLATLDILWKLRGEFMDVTAERYNEVLRKMDAAPVRATLPAFLKLEDLSEEEQAEFLKDPNPHFHVMTDKANHAFPSKYGFIPMTVPGDACSRKRSGSRHCRAVERAGFC